MWLLLVYPMHRTARQGRVAWFEMPSASDVSALSEALEGQGFIDNGFAFAAYLRIVGAGPHLRSGSVYITDGLTAREVLQRVAIGYGTSTVRITIPEGFTKFDIAERLARYGVVGRDEFLAACSDLTLLRANRVNATSAEGYLFPDTYDLQIGSTGPAVVQRLIQGWHARVDSELLLRTPGNELTPHQIVTLASLVEKEAQAADEQTVIAGVFMNRLKSSASRRLESDPTAAYGCKLHREAAPSCAEFDGRHVTPAMVRDVANVYNTYRHEGLPPGPICSPGLPAIRAAISPAHHDLYFFVASGGGRHRFSRTFEEHNRAVDAYRERRQNETPR